MARKASERKVRSDKGISQSNYPVNWIHSKYENVFVTGKQKNKLPPLEILNWLFRYDSESGKLYRIREASGKLYHPEREITYVDSGYLKVSIIDSNGVSKKFLVHQICYYIHTGIEPLQIVDHMDGDSLNNRFDNLRLVTESVNSRNAKMRSDNTSGVTGVYWNKREGKWQGRVSDNTGKQKYLGLFDDIHEAATVVKNFRSNPENGYSVRHGVSL
jgi:hypothetical protein